MATISSTIMLQDRFSSVLHSVINAVNSSVTAMDNLAQSMSANIDMSSFETARSAISSATDAISQFDAELQGLQSQPVQVPIEPIMPDPIDIPNVPPVEVPVTWDTSDLEIFMSSGVERFTQEITSANSMLERLNDTQRQINDMASQTDLMPDNAISDISNVQSRLEALQRRIQDISSNQVDFVSDSNSRELEQLRSQLSNAVREQERLNRAVHNMDVSEANRAYNDLTRTISDAERQIRDNINAQQDFNDALNQGQSAASGLLGKIKGIAMAYLGIQGIKQGMELTDTFANNQARLSLIVDEPSADLSTQDAINAKLQATEALQYKIYEAAQRSRGSYVEMVDVVSKLGLLAGKAFSSNDELVAFTEILQKSFKISGTGVQEMNAALQQLSQAMASGRLQGDEFVSIIENAPRLAMAIEDYCDVSRAELREMSSNGEITADIIKAAVFDMADDVEAKFREMPMTFADAWTVISNTAFMKGSEVMQAVNQALNSDMGRAMIDGISNAICMLIDVLGVALTMIINVGGFIADNWSIIEPIIWGVVTAFGAYVAILTIYNTIQAISNTLQAISAFQSTVRAAALAMEAGATFGATAAQYGLNAALLACPITWVILGIIALIAIFYAAIAAVNKFAGTTLSATGLICGAIMAAVAYVANLFIEVANVVMSVCGAIWDAIAAVANFVGNIFVDPVDAVKALFYDLADAVLSVLSSIAGAVNTLVEPVVGLLGSFGIDVSWMSISVDGLNAARGAIADRRGSLNTRDFVPKSNFKPMDKFDYGQAFDLGYSFGEGIDNSIGSMFDFTSDVGWNPESPNYADLTNGLGNGLGDIGDGVGDLGKGLGDIGKDTKKMADKMELGDEDLKYLRDLAEQEVIDRTVFRDIKIDLGGVTNNVSNNMDLDGIADYIGQSLEEAMIMSAEGVH